MEGEETEESPQANQSELEPIAEVEESPPTQEAPEEAPVVTEEVAAVAEEPEAPPQVEEAPVEDAQQPHDAEAVHVVVEGGEEVKEEPPAPERASSKELEEKRRSRASDQSVKGSKSIHYEKGLLADDEEGGERKVSHPEAHRRSSVNLSKKASSSRLRKRSMSDDDRRTDASSVSLNKKRFSSCSLSRDFGSRTRSEKFGAKVKGVLGSVLSIKRLSVTGEAFDRKTARYANTYKLDADNPFNAEKVEKILEGVMIEALDNLTYDPDKCPKQAKWASGVIRTKVKELEFDRYKLVCLVTIGEKNAQDVLVACRFLWDVDRDRYATFALENTHVFGIAQCFGIYYE